MLGTVRFGDTPPPASPARPTPGPNPVVVTASRDFPMLRNALGVSCSAPENPGCATRARQPPNASPGLAACNRCPSWQARAGTIRNRTAARSSRARSSDAYRQSRSRTLARPGRCACHLVGRLAWRFDHRLAGHRRRRVLRALPFVHDRRLCRPRPKAVSPPARGSQALPRPSRRPTCASPSRPRRARADLALAHHGLARPAHRPLSTGFSLATSFGVGEYHRRLGR